MEFIRICRANFGKRLKERYKLINPMRCRRVKRTGMDVCCLNREALFSSETEDYRIPPEPEENQQVTDTFLAEHPDFSRESFVLPGPLGKTEGQITLWPHCHGTDGFYICRMRRRAT